MRYRRDRTDYGVTEKSHLHPREQRITDTSTPSLCFRPAAADLLYRNGKAHTGLLCTMGSACLGQWTARHTAAALQLAMGGCSVNTFLLAKLQLETVSLFSIGVPSLLPHSLLRGQHITACEAIPTATCLPGATLM